eukprot:Sdes_comp20406_c0_seq1m14425
MQGSHLEKHAAYNQRTMTSPNTSTISRNSFIKREPYQNNIALQTYQKKLASISNHSTRNQQPAVMNNQSIKRQSHQAESNPQVEDHQAWKHKESPSVQSCKIFALCTDWKQHKRNCKFFSKKNNR